MKTLDRISNIARFALGVALAAGLSASVLGVTADGKLLVHTLPTGDIKISLEMMQEERGIIDDVFLVSLFKVLSEHPDMTATQVTANTAWNKVISVQITLTMTNPLYDAKAINGQPPTVQFTRTAAVMNQVGL